MQIFWSIFQHQLENNYDFKGKIKYSPVEHKLNDEEIDLKNDETENEALYSGFSFGSNSWTCVNMFGAKQY